MLGRYLRLSLLFALAIPLQILAAQNTPDLTKIVTRMEQVQQQNRQNSRAYTLSREYRFYSGDKAEPKSEVLVEVRFVPPNEKTFRIEKSEGSGRGKKVVENLLESEAEAARKDPPMLDRQHYDFTFLGQESIEGTPAWVLGLIPRQEQKQYVRGKVWVDRNTYRIRRVEGDVARNPSWWLKKVHVTLDYGEASGLWLHMGTRAVVDVRFFGKHIVTAESLNVRTDPDLATRRSDPPGTAEQNHSGTLHRVSPLFSGAVVSH